MHRNAYERILKHRIAMNRICNFFFLFDQVPRCILSHQILGITSRRFILIEKKIQIKSDYKPLFIKNIRKSLK